MAPGAPHRERRASPEPSDLRTVREQDCTPHSACDLPPELSGIRVVRLRCTFLLFHAPVLSQAASVSSWEFWNSGCTAGSSLTSLAVRSLSAAVPLLWFNVVPGGGAVRDLKPHLPASVPFPHYSFIRDHAVRWLVSALDRVITANCREETGH